MGIWLTGGGGENELSTRDNHSTQPANHATVQPPACNPNEQRNTEVTVFASKVRVPIDYDQLMAWSAAMESAHADIHLPNFAEAQEAGTLASTVKNLSRVISRRKRASLKILSEKTFSQEEFLVSYWCEILSCAELAQSPRLLGLLRLTDINKAVHQVCR